MGCAHVAVVLTKADRLYNNENRENTIIISNNEKEIKVKKRRNENLPGENDYKIDENENNLARD